MFEAVSPLETAHTPELEAEITHAFEAYWHEAAADHTDSFTPDELAERRQKALDRELCFAKKVSDAALEMSRRHTGPVVLLFDVDETIARNEYTGKKFTRPALAPTVRGLQQSLGNRLEVGLLTSRSEPHLNEELGNPTYLADIIETVNPNFVFSSRDDARIYKADPITDPNDPNFGYDDFDYELRSIESGTNEKRCAEYAADILRPEIVEALRSGDHPEEGMWWNVKLGILQKIARTHPERAFVFVEDLWCADSVRDDHPQVMGVRVYSDAGFFSI